MTLVKIRNAFISNRTLLFFSHCWEISPSAVKPFNTRPCCTLLASPASQSTPLLPVCLFLRSTNAMFVCLVLLPVLNNEGDGGKVYLTKQNGATSVCDIFTMTAFAPLVRMTVISVSFWGPPKPEVASSVLSSDSSQANNGLQFTCALKWQRKSNCNFQIAKGKETFSGLT